MSTNEGTRRLSKRQRTAENAPSDEQISGEDRSTSAAVAQQVQPRANEPAPVLPDAAVTAYDFDASERDFLSAIPDVPANQQRYEIWLAFTNGGTTEGYTVLFPRWLKVDTLFLVTSG